MGKFHAWLLLKRTLHAAVARAFWLPGLVTLRRRRNARLVHSYPSSRPTSTGQQAACCLDVLARNRMDRRAVLCCLVARSRVFEQN